MTRAQASTARVGAENDGLRSEVRSAGTELHAAAGGGGGGGHVVRHGHSSWGQVRQLTEKLIGRAEESALVGGGGDGGFAPDMVSAARVCPIVCECMDRAPLPLPRAATGIWRGGGPARVRAAGMCAPARAGATARPLPPPPHARARVRELSTTHRHRRRRARQVSTLVGECEAARGAAEARDRQLASTTAQVTSPPGGGVCIYRPP